MNFYVKTSHFSVFCVLELFYALYINRAWARRSVDGWKRRQVSGCERRHVGTRARERVWAWARRSVSAWSGWRLDAWENSSAHIFSVRVKIHG